MPLCTFVSFVFQKRMNHKGHEGTRRSGLVLTCVLYLARRLLKAA